MWGWPYDCFGHMTKEDSLPGQKPGLWGFCMFLLAVLSVCHCLEKSKLAPSPKRDLKSMASQTPKRHFKRQSSDAPGAVYRNSALDEPNLTCAAAAVRYMTIRDHRALRKYEKQYLCSNS